MVLVSAKEMIEKAHEGHYAIGAFNINNMEWTKAILAACQQANSPVILQVSEGAAKYMCGFKQCADMVKNIHDHMGITVPVALHLDHGTFEGAKACIEAGFTSVMFDGSHYDFAENLEKSKEIIKLAHSQGVSVECEVGGIGGTEDGVTSNGELADPKECAEIASLGVDFLAAGIGNIHGVYPADWAGLNFERLSEIDAAVNGKPLVLHGGSGIPFDQVHKAITMGVSKINVNTDLQIVFAKATREYIEAGKDQQGKGFDPRKLLKPGADAIVAKVIEMVNQFGSADKA
ncbi:MULTISPECIES: class II fructose-1,6-bisphosphate aldolase [Solobacterium]|jgi:fructose-1,6-bisphosphate aldolase, class II|uniref:Fructose-1,6-bisphosphate aldolase, class II n=1 Tax=Solobacterium moorei F0204 TaxID=706433 RepID=E7MQU2_9FIRM|nr:MULTISPECIES: class II fructose-1,6-bisphosphate aldolase [Solobacterium]EFW23568.1 fructose-1,6-bisphosphate aldolase, class II [Solobacterium moorei F0204]MBF1071772.1 class II fructose-1,6-bisphosphate aldolase [Solobacterium sp.]MBF1077698.1 class II fructose-1,6-bisphosphate aldolase [Solobacterium sp.]MBF1083386.1 class II fructose-1,6-bisphosphate aldolase [Solobacterium sp.]MBF1085429.1 class II fructose-1,6-bisphosphate aldolase [Solobacterium sp.]